MTHVTLATQDHDTCDISYTGSYSDKGFGYITFEVKSALMSPVVLGVKTGRDNI